MYAKRFRLWLSVTIYRYYCSMPREANISLKRFKTKQQQKKCSYSQKYIFPQRGIWPAVGIEPTIGSYRTQAHLGFHTQNERNGTVKKKLPFCSMEHTAVPFQRIKDFFFLVCGNSSGSTFLAHTTSVHFLNSTVYPGIISSSVRSI